MEQLIAAIMLTTSCPVASHFCEMNTRLQVEHPISEMISGLDLVALQLDVAAGNPLPLTQSQVQRNGHAFEARIYAENTRANFLPDVGRLQHVRLPETSASVRVDTGFGTGDEISVHYDPMIAKLIVHGADRVDALRVLRKALAEYQVVGPKTNIEFLQSLAAHRAFVEGKVETAFIPKYGEELQPPLVPPPTPAQLAVGALYLALRERRTASQAEGAGAGEGGGAWTRLAHFRTAPAAQASARTYSFAGKVQVTSAKGDTTSTEERLVPASVKVLPHAGQEGRFDLEITSSSSTSTGGQQETTATSSTVLRNVEARLERDGVTLTVTGLPLAGAGGAEGSGAVTQRSVATVISRKPTRSEAASSGVSGEKLDLFLPRPASASASASSSSSTSDGGLSSTAQIELQTLPPSWLDEVLGKREVAKGSVVCPMPSKVVEIRVKEGQRVEEGEVVVVLEAMKTEHVLRAPRAGVVAKVAVREVGELVKEGVELVQFVKEEAEAEAEGEPTQA